MDSSPKQHIDSLPGATRQESYHKLKLLCLARSMGFSEHEVAKKAGFGSTEGMYQQLKVWGLFGFLPPGEKSQQFGGEEPTDKRKRQAQRGDGEAIEPPSAAGATELFKEALKVYTEDVAKLEFREEHLKDERFLATYVYPPETKRRATVLRREKLSAVEWEFFCSMYGKDPATTEEFRVYHTTYMHKGASQSPPEPLDRLIGMYVLAGLPVGPLLKQLHPSPDEVDRKQLQRQIDGVTGKKHLKRVGLIPQVERLGRLVRGAPLRTGHDTGEVSPLEHAAAERIRQHRQNIERAKEVVHFRDPLRKTRHLKNLEKNMYEELNQVYGLSKSEVDRLERLRLPPQRSDYREHAD